MTNSIILKDIGDLISPVHSSVALSRLLFSQPQQFSLEDDVINRWKKIQSFSALVNGWEAERREDEIVSKSTQNEMFDRLFNLKLATSVYAIHLAKPERDRIFKHLDMLMNEEDWDNEERLLEIGSYEMFLRWLVYIKWFRWTSLGISPRGLMLVAWLREKSLITAEFFPDGKINWTATIAGSAEPEFASGSCTLVRFVTVVSPYANWEK